VAVDTSSLFAQIIQDHLELKERNAPLEPSMPLGRYKAADPFENHPLFKSEEQARLEETMDGEVVAHVASPPTQPWPGEETAEHPALDDTDSFWGRSRDFDWGE
jgi:hypothetical protein